MNIFKRIIQRRKILKECIFIERGKWKFDDNINHLYKLNSFDSVQKKLLLTLIPRKRKTNITRKFLNKLKHIVSKIIIINVNPIMEREISGTLIIFGNSNMYYKVFDFKKKRILIMFKENRELLRYLNNYNHFIKYLTIPMIVHESESYIIEYLLVDNYKYKSKPSSIIKILKDYDGKLFKYILENKMLTEYLHIPPSLNKNYFVNNDFYKNEYIKTINKFKTTLFPNFKLHGDLKRNNVIMNKTGIYYIDFELSDNYPFFYDFFKLLQNEVNNKEYTLLEYLLNDENMSFLEKYINKLLDKSISISLKEYIHLFFNSLYYYEIKNSINEEINNYVKLHYNIIEYIDQRTTRLC